MTKKPYRGAVFDLDGTLLDTLADIAWAVNAALREAGFPTHELAAFRYFVGDGMAATARRALPDSVDETRVEAITAAIRDHYAREWRRRTRPFAGVPAMLARLSQMGIRMAVLSNKPHPMTLLTVTNFLGADTFKKIYGVSDEVPPKPNLTGIRRVLDEMKLAPHEVIYLGDTNTDMHTAKGMGLFAVGVSWGFRPIEELLAHGADAIIAQPADFLGFFDGHCL